MGDPSTIEYWEKQAKGSRLQLSRSIKEISSLKERIEELEFEQMGDLVQHYAPYLWKLLEMGDGDGPGERLRSPVSSGNMVLMMNKIKAIMK